MADSALSGSIQLLFLFDVCEEIRTDQLPSLLGGRDPGDATSRRRPSLESVRFERPPVVKSLGPLVFESGARMNGEVNFYNYGAVCLKLDLPFAGLDWAGLVALSNQWVADPQLEREAANIVRHCLEEVEPALVRPNPAFLSEDYSIVHLNNESRLFRGTDLIAGHGGDIACIVRGEMTQLSEAEEREILGSRMSYYPEDLLVVGWSAAFLCDTAEGAAPTVQLLEYANTQLLEFRYYDTVLTRVLEGVYSTLEKRGGMFARWRLAREAQHLNKIRLEVRELTERIDTSVKFLSDMYSARQHRMAASKIGVDDYRRLVESKLHMAGDLYTLMMDQFHSSRAFVLELMVVIILIIDLVYLFRGKA